MIPISGSVKRLSGAQQDIVRTHKLLVGNNRNHGVKLESFSVAVEDCKKQLDKLDKHQKDIVALRVKAQQAIRETTFAGSESTDLISTFGHMDLYEDGAMKMIINKLKIDEKAIARGNMAS